MEHEGELLVEEILAALAPGSRVLDLGCGSGSFPYARYPHILISALDMTVRQDLPAFPSNVDFRVGDSAALPYADGTFDVVIATWVFEHFHDMTRSFQEAERVLKLGGVLHMALPHCRSVEDELYRAIFAGGGHLQRPTFESVMHLAYRHTGFKLVSYAEWAACFSFLRDSVAMRALAFSMVDSLKHGGGQDVRLRSNFVFLFRRERARGFREFNMTCAFCGGGSHLGAEQLHSPWVCPICKEPNGGRKISLRDRDELEAEMKLIWKRRPWIFAMSYGRAALPERILARLQAFAGRLRFLRFRRR